MQKTLVAAFAALMGVGSAQAADLGGGYGGSLKDAPVVQSYAPSWAGLYIGGSVGFGVGDTSGKARFDDFDYEDEDVSKIEVRKGYSLVDLVERVLQSKYDVNGAVYGVHAGYNVQRGNLVYGLEAGFNGSAIDGASPCVGLLFCERELDWYATGVARLGYASGSTMFYGFGGLAWGNVTTKIGLLSPGLPFLEGEETHLGWVAGAGLEHAFNDRFSVRIEYSHVDLGEEDTKLSLSGYTLPITDEVDLSFDAVKIGASYKLTGGSQPLK